MSFDLSFLPSSCCDTLSRPDSPFKGQRSRRSCVTFLKQHRRRRSETRNTYGGPLPCSLYIHSSVTPRVLNSKASHASCRSGKIKLTVPVPVLELFPPTSCSSHAPIFNWGSSQCCKQISHHNTHIIQRVLPRACHPSGSLPYPPFHHKPNPFLSFITAG